MAYSPLAVLIFSSALWTLLAYAQSTLSPSATVPGLLPPLATGPIIPIRRPGGRIECIDSVTQLVRPCPPGSTRRGNIILAVVVSIVGAIILGLLIWYILRCISLNRRQRPEKITTIPLASAGPNKEYRPLMDDEHEWHPDRHV